MAVVVLDVDAEHLLEVSSSARAGPGRMGARTWSIPAKAYWLSGPDNHPTSTPSPEGRIAPSRATVSSPRRAVLPPLSPQCRVRPGARESALIVWVPESRP